MRASTLHERPARSPESHDPEPTEPLHVFAICWKQWQTERALRRRGLDFRTTDEGAARQAYEAMSPAEFAAINGRQAWANRRTIERSLRGLLPRRPLLALDLGSGIGESTACLARLLPAGSHVVGIEFAESLVEVARDLHRRYRRDGRSSPSFVVGSVTETFRDERGEPFTAGSVDLVNASGIVGHHLDRGDVERVAFETARVLRRGGIAALDVGPRMRSADLRDVMDGFSFVPVRRTRSNPLDRTGQVVFRKV